MSRVPTEMKEWRPAEVRRGEHEQTLIGIYDSTQRAERAERILQSRAGLAPRDLTVLSATRRDGERERRAARHDRRGIVSTALRNGRSVLVATVDETDAFTARELIDQETRSIATFALPPAHSRRGAAHRTLFSARQLLGIVGPGVITGGADNDPAGIATYSIVGSSAGYTQNWLLLLSTPLLIAVQTMNARVGNVLKSDLATAIKDHFGVNVARGAAILVLIANVITIGADLLMMAAVSELITGISFRWFIVPYAALMVGFTVFFDYRKVARALLWLAAVFAAYIVAAFLSRPDWGTVLRNTFFPQVSLDPTYFLGAVGLLGTTITPYLFFWQTSAEIEERRGVQQMRRSQLDISAGMVWSNVSAFFIITVTATVLYTHHATIHTAADAARALEPFAGSYAKYLFSVGVIGAGMLAIPVLAASSAYCVSGVFDWRRGLDRSLRRAPQFYLVLALAVLVGVQLAVVNVNPVRALFYSQVLDGLIAPVLVVLLLVITSSPRIMGSFANGPVMKVIGWSAVAVLGAADVALMYTIARQGLPG